MRKLTHAVTLLAVPCRRACDLVTGEVVGPRMALLILAVALAGCSAPAATKASRPPRNPAAEIAAAPEPTDLLAFDGHTGRRWEWPALAARMGACDAVFVGEQHDDASAHRAQRTLVALYITARPGAALSMEMLERDDQPAVDDYLAGRVTLEEFVDRAGVRNWAGSGTWLAWYQPIVDAARAAGAPVVAANAPRRYVSRANREGYGALRELPPEDRALFEIPDALPHDAYRQRLADLMRDARGPSASSPPTDGEIDAFQRAQLVWDTTMGASAASALERAPGVIHLAGAFHVMRDGATVTSFRERRPGAKAMTVVCVPEAATSLRDDDRGLADVVLYTRTVSGAGDATGTRTAARP